MTYVIKNVSKKSTLCTKALLARTFFERLVGLLNKKALGNEEALIFYNAPSIHMFFMRFPIDVVFLDNNKRTIKICRTLQPWTTAGCLKAVITIELPSGKCTEKSLELGDILEISPL